MNGVTVFRSFNNSACKRVLEAGYFRFREVVVKRITVTKFRVNNGGVNGTDCYGMADTAKLTNMVTA